MSTLSPLESLLINRCAFPKLVNTPYGQRTVPCGKCLYCRKSHGRTMQQLIHNEMQDATCVQFFTLTYHQFFLPRIILNSTGEEDFPYSVPENASVFRFAPDYQRRTFISQDKKTQIYYPKTQTTETKTLTNKEYKISSHLSHEYNSNSSSDIEENNIGILYTPDLQNFFKRLRKALNTSFNKDIRYFALAEYGGNHFRPHFHILIFTRHFNATEIQNAVYDSWHYGNIDYAGEPSNSTAASNYVSQYVTSTVTTPLLLENISKTRTFHSKYFGLNIIRNNLQLFLTHPFYLATPPTELYKITFYIPNNSNSVLSVKLPSIPTEAQIKSFKKQLNRKHSVTCSSITYEISSEPCDIKVNNYVINYVFPRPFGYARLNDYSTQLILELYDTLNKHFVPTYENFLIWLKNRVIFEQSEIYDLALGLVTNNNPKDTETPSSLLRNANSEILDSYILFYNIQKSKKDIKIFQDYKTYHKALITINQIIDELPTDYELTPLNWSAILISCSHLHNRLLSTFFISKHFCTNIKKALINTIFYDGFTFNWHLYNKKRRQFEQIQKEQQLYSYFSILETNTVFPYECFTEDLGNDPENVKFILPLQKEYLFNQTKHKELNNKLSPIFFDDTEYITY